LFVRTGCHLCEAFLEELEAANRDSSRQIHIRDVDNSEDWIQQYGDRVPALVIDGELICEYFYDPDKVSTYFRD
jgi:hypothetical protein